MSGPHVQQVPYPVYQSAPVAPVTPVTPIAQTDIQSEADKAAEAVKTNARKATGRKATILTSPLGVLQQSSNSGTTLLGG